MGNYPSTPCESTKIQKLEDLLRCSRKKHRVVLQLHLFLGAEFSEMEVFGNAELERSCKNGSGVVPNTPLI
jgi:hypothetical protein